MRMFSKDEKLCSRKKIDILFAEGKSFIKYPVRITFSLEKRKEKFPCQVLIIVPKRRIKKAVDRNLIKRRIREVYRIEKAELYTFLEENEINMNLMILYVSNELLEYHEIKVAIEKSIQHIKNYLIQ